MAEGEAVEEAEEDVVVGEEEVAEEEDKILLECLSIWSEERYEKIELGETRLITRLITFAIHA